jgi:hypothetical protein
LYLESWRILLVLGNPSWRPKKKYMASFDENVDPFSHFIFFILDLGPACPKSLVLGSEICSS